MSKHMDLSVRVPIEQDNPSIIREEELCIKCGMCRNVCQEKIGVHGTYTLEETGDRAICIHCGQCANVCPVNSIHERYEYGNVREAIQDPEKVVIVSTSPSVRAALGEAFGMPEGSFVEGKMVALLRKLGFDYVLDTNFAADLTIMEEAAELIERLKAGERLPQFTSCCPAWVEYVETYYPELMGHLSTAKSPISMQGPTIKTYFAGQKEIRPETIVNVALTPCTAKKYEIRREELHGAADYLQNPEIRDMDYVITTRELARWAKEEGIDFAALEDGNYDDLMSEASGGGVLFGNSGGVMEAALRTAYYMITGENPPADLLEYEPVRGTEGVKTGTVTIGEQTLKVAAVYGTANAKKLIESWKQGDVHYDFIEVMTCPCGCIGGGGQPKEYLMMSGTLHENRMKALYRKESGTKLRSSYENPEIIELYQKFYGAPLHELSEKMLHTHYRDRSGDLGKK